MRIWLRYFCIWPGLLPIGDPNQAGVIIAQAFGRNTYIDERLFEVRRIFDEAGSDFAAISKLRDVMFYPGEIRFDPGIPNKMLAKECQELVDKYNLSAIVQWEIATAFDLKWYAEHRDKIFCLWPSTDQNVYFSTHLVKKQAVEKMIQMGWTNPMEVAHKRQIARAYLIVKKLLKEHKVRSSGVIVVDQKTDFFDPNSVQLWTKNKWLWLAREGLTRIHHLLKRLVI